MRFMFTRFVTKLIAFRRRIADLIGYTGGDSLEQIILAPEIATLRVQSYLPAEMASEPSFAAGDRELWMHLPESLKKHPAHYIESLPNYRRPSLLAWLNEKGRSSSDNLTIGDLMDLGFDPTRLKEFTMDSGEYIFERIQVRQLPDLKKKKEVLERMGPKMLGIRVKNAWLKTNPPLLAMRDRGNAYVLRRKIGGIHWEEAMEQLESSPHLKSLNASMKIDRLIFSTVLQAKEMMAEKLEAEQEILLDSLAFFVSWDLSTNRPRLTIDFQGAFLESVWMA
jgi:hypothetical protein